MSRFFSEKYRALIPYTPGEQPQDKQYIKLNTNESPFPPSPKATAYAAAECERLALYPDPTCRALTEQVAALCGVSYDEVLLTNGSDEILNFAFMAFCDARTPAAFPEISYGFYKVFAEINNVPYTEIPLNEDFSLDITSYFGLKKTIFIANPNAPTGLALSVAQIEEIVKYNPDTVVVIDEAYVDFGAESCIPLIHRYDNLLVTQTFSKSRSFAGGRLGFGVGSAKLIQDLNTIKYSTNPYNINRLTMAAARGILEDEPYTQANCRAVMQTRAYTAAKLHEMGFEMTESVTNFLFVKHRAIDGAALYQALKDNGILVRHFSTERLAPYVRITVGSQSQMETLIATLERILKEVSV